MVSCTCMKCKDCGSISVVLTKDLWKLYQCPKCKSKNLSNLDDVDFIGEKEDEQSN